MNSSTTIATRKNHPWPDSTVFFDGERTTVRIYFGEKSYSDSHYRGRVEADDIFDADPLADWLTEYPAPVDLRALS